MCIVSCFGFQSVVVVVVVVVDEGTDSSELVRLSSVSLVEVYLPPVRLCAAFRIQVIGRGN